MLHTPENKILPHFCMNCERVQQAHGKWYCWSRCHNIAWQHGCIFGVSIDTFNQNSHWQTKEVCVGAVYKT